MMDATEHGHAPGTCNPSREVLGLDAGPGLVFVYFREFSCTAASMQTGVSMKSASAHALRVTHHYFQEAIVSGNEM